MVSFGLFLADFGRIENSKSKLDNKLGNNGNGNAYHFEATLTIKRTFPLNLLRGTSFPSISYIKVS